MHIIHLNLNKLFPFSVTKTTRKYPIAIYLNRNCVKDYKIPNTRQIIENGTGIMIPVYALHMDEKYYDEPLRFDPERFSEENSIGKKQVNRPFMPFRDGPRSCIAMRLGTMQIKIGLVMMLQKFRFEIENKSKIGEMNFDSKSFRLAPVGGIELRILRR